MTIRPVAHARHYELRYAAVPAGGAVHWTTIVAFFFVLVVKLIVDVFDEGAARLTSAAFSGSNLENGFVFNDALTPESSIYLLSQRIHRMILHQSSLAPEFTRTVTEWTDDKSADENDYSARSATVGSMLHARRAGR